MKQRITTFMIESLFTNSTIRTETLRRRLSQAHGRYFGRGEAIDIMRKLSYDSLIDERGNIHWVSKRTPKETENEIEDDDE